MTEDEDEAYVEEKDIKRTFVHDWRNNDDNEEGGEDTGKKEQSSLEKKPWPLRSLESSSQLFAV